MAAWLLREMLERDQRLLGGYLEVRETRLVWWLEHRIRLFRLDLTTQQLEALLHHVLIDWLGRANVQGRLKTHDKNTDMFQFFAQTIVEASSIAEIFRYEPE